MKTLKAPRRGGKQSHHRETAEILGPVLADLVAMSLATKQAHWNVEGPHFSPLHELFDKMTDEYREWYDEIAERILALKQPADGRVGTVAKRSLVEALPEGMIPGGKAVELMLDRVERLAGRLRATLDRLGELDPITEDMVIGITAGVEKQAWMLRVQAS